MATGLLDEVAAGHQGAFRTDAPIHQSPNPAVLARRNRQAALWRGHQRARLEAIGACQQLVLITRSTQDFVEGQGLAAQNWSC